MEKIKILHICDKLGREGSTIHGVSQLFSWWWPLFNRDRFLVDLIVLRSEKKSAKALREKGVTHVEWHKNKFNFFVYRDIVKYIEENGVHVLHLHGYGASNIGLFAARKTGVCTIVHEHFVDPAYPFYQKPFDVFLAKKLSRGIAVSQSVKEFMAEQRAVPSNSIDVIYNGAPLERFSLSREKDAMEEKKRLGIPLDVKVVATIGRLDEQKGNCYFLASAKEILEKGHNVHFALFGDGPLLDELKKQCRDTGIDNKVLFTGYYSDIPLAHSMIDVQVFPSLWEGTPLTMFEAFASGKPIVSTDVDGLGEIIRNRETGLLVPVKEPGKMTEKIIELLTDQGVATHLSVAVKKESEKYDIKSCVRKMEEIYDAIYCKSYLSS